jgi:hypothetical protein
MFRDLDVVGDDAEGGPDDAVACLVEGRAPALLVLAAAVFSGRVGGDEQIGEKFGQSR